jgi:hypothetical protein
MLKNNEKGSVHQESEHSNQNENRSSFSELVNLKVVIGNWFERFKRKTYLEKFIFLYRISRNLYAIYKLIVFLSTLI